MPTYNPHTDRHSIEKYQFLRHFLPHPETKKRAGFLSTRALAMYSVLVMFAFVAFKIIPKLYPGVLGYASNITVNALLDGTNRLRSGEGLGPLRLNPELTEAAYEKAEHMFENDYWAHVAPDGTQPWDFILGAEYDYSYAGENLAKNFNSSSDVVTAWYRSPSHKENLINPNYDEIGFAVVNGVLDGYETTLVVQMFGKPRNPELIATAFEEEKLLKSLVPISTPLVLNRPSVVEAPVSVLPSVDVTTVSRTLTYVLGGFLLTLLALDIWYTKRKAIPKLTGHTYAHMLFLVVTLVGVWVVLSPGKVL